MNLRPFLTTASTAAIATLLLLGSEREAHALGPVDIEIAAKGGVGSNPAPSGSPNPLGIGLGARAGIALPLGLYAGVNIVDYLGSDTDGISEHALQYGLEAGWGISVLFLTIRPQIGIGNINFSYSVDAVQGLSGSSGYLYLEPGLTGLLTFGSFLVGADVNALVIPSVNNSVTNTSSTYTALTIHAQVGVKF